MESWLAVDQYFLETLTFHDSHLEAALETTEAAEMPPISVSPNLGKFLHIIARLRGARKILEIGTLGGYSTIWLARALPEGGRLITLEADEKHAQVAQANLERAGLQKRVEIRLGKALETLPALESEAPFDLTFIDADKANIPSYFKQALDYSREGSVIIVDNVVRGGKVAEEDSDSPDVQGVREFLEMAAREPRVEITALQTVGVKGYDGFAFALVVA